MMARSQKLVFACLLFLTACQTASKAEITQTKPCVPRHYPGQSSFVCVCTAHYCDEIAANSRLGRGKFAAYVSTQDKYRLAKFVLDFKAETNEEASSVPRLTVARSQTYQTILGFGGAFTDATGINIASLSDAAADRLLKAYFAPGGSEYSLGRVPMASCDFSTRVYSYDDIGGDLDLKHFSLAPEDHKYKIPYIRAARQLSRRPLTLFASPWSAPWWMKNSDRMAGNGTLRGQPGGRYYKTWANYFVRFLQEYAKQNISFWGLTAQNEPTTGFFPNYPFQTLGFTPETQRDFIARDLGPTLEGHGFGEVKLMIMDDQRVNIPDWARRVLSSPAAARYVSGIAVHWYADFLDPAFPLSLTHEAFPDQFLLYTEACEGSTFPWEPVVALGDWRRFHSYANNIMDDLANWVVGWTDWNMALDLEGGPNWVRNFVDSPIIVNKTADEFYKQPMYYALAHFSKFLPAGCIRVGLTANSDCDLKYLAFSCPDNSTVIQLNNRADSPQTLDLADPERGVATVTVPPSSHVTLVWW